MAVRLNNRIHAAEGDFRRILVVLRLPKGQNGGKQKMKKEDREMIEKIMATEKVGYAYVYPMDGGARKEHYISMTSENIANYIGTYMVEAE